jgi:DNA-binding CsgD family transcriptional regulator
MGNEFGSTGEASRLVHIREARAVASSSMDAAYQVIARGTASPVLVTDERWHIVALNPEAERLLGCSSREAAGQTCHALLCGRDRYGNHFCHEKCVVGTMALRGEPVRPFELDVVSAAGEIVRAACSVIVLHDGPQYRIVHILTPLPRADEHVASRAAAPNRTTDSNECGATATRPYALTARESEVLRLLAKGQDCRQIATGLFISLPTVRNHVHNLFRKMNVHSQVEAVVQAYREGLI